MMNEHTTTYEVWERRGGFRAEPCLTRLTKDQALAQIEEWTAREQYARPEAMRRTFFVVERTTILKEVTS